MCIYDKDDLKLALSFSSFSMNEPYQVAIYTHKKQVRWRKKCIIKFIIDNGFDFIQYCTSIVAINIKGYSDCLKYTKPNTCGPHSHYKKLPSF